MYVSVVWHKQKESSSLSMCQLGDRRLFLIRSRCQLFDRSTKTSMYVLLVHSWLCQLRDVNKICLHSVIKKKKKIRKRRKKRGKISFVGLNMSAGGASHWKPRRDTNSDSWDFSPRVGFQCRLSYGTCPYSPPFAIASSTSACTWKSQTLAATQENTAHTDSNG